MYSAHREKLTSEALRYESQSFTLQTHNACLHLVSVHQTSNSSHLTAVCYSFINPERMKAKCAELADLQFTDVLPLRYTTNLMQCEFRNSIETMQVNRH